MSSSRTIKGRWWFPNKREAKEWGTLTLNLASLPTLTVTTANNGVLEESNIHEPVIHGHDEQGRPITLLGVGRPQVSGTLALTESTYRPLCVLLGIHVDDKQSFTAHKLIIELQHLHSWSGLTGFERAVFSGSDRCSISYERPEALTFTISPSLNVGLHVITRWSDRRHEKTITEGSSISFESPQGFSLDRCFELVRAMRHMLHFAATRPVYPVRVVALNNEHGIPFSQRFYREEIEIWTSNNRQSEIEVPLPGEWVFHLADVRGRFDSLMRDWLDYVNRFNEAFDCYSTTIYHDLPLTVEHLSLTQALDAYHGVRFGSHKKNEFQPKIEELVKLHDKPLKGIVDDVKDFSERVLATRNYYTHHNPKWKTGGKVAEGADLFRMNKKLLVLFQMCVLADMGIAEERFSRLHRQIEGEMTMLS